MLETRELICLVATIKPIGGQGWNEVERQFNEKASAGMVGFKVRGANSLKSRFQGLASIEKPTGEGEMPQLILVRMAKEVNAELHSMIDAGTLEEEEELQDEIGEGLEEALHEGPEPGEADSSEPTARRICQPSLR
jgi:hypothetical protein